MTWVTRGPQYCVPAAVIALLLCLFALFSGAGAARAADASAAPVRAAGVAMAAGAATATTATAPGSPAPLVLVGAGGLSWSDVSERATPMLWAMLGNGAASTMTVRSVHTNTCPVDGWLTLSAGTRAADVDDSVDPSNSRPACRAVPHPVAPAQAVPRWGSFLQAARRAGFDASPGLLGDLAARAGRCLEAVGPGAAVGAARSSGVVEHYAPLRELDRALTRCRVTLVDVGAVRDPADVDPRDEVRPTQSRAAQVHAMDVRIASVVAAAPDGTDVMVASLADAGRSERLRLLVATGPSYPTGILRSSSTRQPGLVQLPDLTPTVLAALGIPAPDALGGAPLTVEPTQDHSTIGARARLRGLVDDDLASHEVHALVPPFFNGLVLAQLGIDALAAVVWRRRWGSEPARVRLLRVVRQVATIAATVPVSTFLANLLPWWRSSVPLLAVIGSVALFVAVISAVALLGPWRRWLLGPLAVVCGATMAVLSVDVMTGSRLQVSSLMGLQPVVGGRFYGMGNVTFAVFATATMLFCIAVADFWVARGRTRVAAAAVGIIGLLAVVVDASPAWGSDFGGPPALLPGVALLVLAVLQVRVTLRRVLLIVGGTAVFLVAVAVADWLRPPASQSHLGRFVQTVIDGGAAEVIRRKLDQNLSILFHSTLSVLVPVGLLFVLYILARPTSWGSRALERAYERAPLLRPGLLALMVLYVIGFALNDSGTAIPAVGAAVSIPLVIAVSVRALEDEAARAAVPATRRPAPRRPAKGARRGTGPASRVGSSTPTKAAPTPGGRWRR